MRTARWRLQLACDAARDSRRHFEAADGAATAPGGYSSEGSPMTAGVTVMKLRLPLLAGLALAFTLAGLVRFGYGGGPNPAAEAFDEDRFEKEVLVPACTDPMVTPRRACLPLGD